MDKLDMVLLMSVNPGFGGQTFIPTVMDKIVQARELIERSGKDIRLEVDGGVNIDNIRAIADAGADTFVAGSAIFKDEDQDYTTVIDQMHRELGEV